MMLILSACANSTPVALPPPQVSLPPLPYPLGEPVAVPPLRKVDARVAIAECRQALRTANQRQRNVKQFYNELRASLEVHGHADE